MQFFCVARSITKLEVKGVYEVSLIKKRCYCLKVVTSNLLILNFNIRRLVMLICLRQEPNRISRSEYFYEIS